LNQTVAISILRSMCINLDEMLEEAGHFGLLSILKFTKIMVTLKNIK